MIFAFLLLFTSAAQQLPGILIERRVVDELGVTVGDTVQARALASDDAVRPFVVQGIYERPADPNRISRNELEVRFHLPDLEGLVGLDDRVDRFALALRPGADAEAVARWVEGLAFGTQAIGAAELSEEASTTFQVVSRFHDAIGLITMLASGIFLLCLMVIRVDERRGDVRMMRLVGISGTTVFRAIVLEAVAIAAVAAVLGAVLGAGMTVLVNAYYAAYYDTNLRFAILTPAIVGTAVTVGVLLGVGAGALAALRIARVSPQRLGER